MSGKLKKRAITVKTNEVKRGFLFKFYQNYYMVLDRYENKDFFICIRVSTKNGRFNTLKTLNLHKDYFIKSEPFYRFKGNKSFIDKRDKEIFEEFQNYVKEADFKYHRIKYRCTIAVDHIGLKKFKQYSQQII